MNIPTEESNSVEAEEIQTFASQAGIALVGKVGGRFLNLVAEVAIARLLGPALFGAYAIGITLLRLVGTLAPLGLNNGVIWFGARFWKIDTGRLKGSVLHSIIIGSISGSIIGILIFLGASSIAVFYNEPELIPVLRWYAPACLFLTVLHIAASATRITLKTKYAIIAEDIIQPIIFIALLVVFISITSNFIGTLSAATISYGVVLVVALYYVYKLFFLGKPDPIIYPVRTAAILQYSLPTAFTGFLGTANLWIDRFIVKYYRPISDVGIYQAASQSSMLFSIILSAINSIFGPMIADYYHRSEMERLEMIYRISTKWGLYLGTPFFLAVLFAPKTIITTVFGASYANAAMPMVILTIGQLINLSTGSVGYLLIMTANQNLWLAIIGGSLLLSIVLNMLLTPPYGLPGSAVSTSISISVMYLYGLYFVRSRLKLWPYDRRYYKGAVASILASIYVYFLPMLSIKNLVVNFILLFFGAYLIFGAVLLLLGLDSEDKHLLQILKKKIGKGMNFYHK